MILDFAGDAHRPLAERRAKGTPLADLAGMLRSFDQAAWASVFRFAESDPVAVDQLLTPALAWRDLARAAFLAEYRAVIDDCPGGVDGTEDLLRLLTLQTIARRDRPRGHAAERPASNSIERAARTVPRLRSEPGSRCRIPEDRQARRRSRQLWNGLPGAGV